MSKKASNVDHVYLAKVLKEIQEQPPWRHQANREMDYFDGNQLDAAILQQMEASGIPPSIENLIAGTIKDITGMEEKNRTDFKVEPDGDIGDEESDQVAKAIGYKLSKAERGSGADKACGDAYLPQAAVGIGWVEVSRQTDPFKFPYRCNAVHRNELFWDMLAKEPDLSDARWMLRKRWTDVAVAEMMFPGKKEMIKQAGENSWLGPDDVSLESTDAGDADTNLYQSWDIERGWMVEEQEWRLVEKGRVCLFELYTKEWSETLVLKMKGGRVVELDDQNESHLMAISLGATVEKAKISTIWKHFFLGPHKLHEEAIEFRIWPYVRFVGELEDRTRIPYGVIRHLMYLQDEANARISKQQWLLTATTTIRTNGAVLMTDEVFRAEAGRPDADFKLDVAHMGMPGARFERSHNESLNEQQYKRLLDLRESIRNIGGISAAMSGDAKADNSGALSQMVEQSAQGLARLNGNFAYSRMIVGDLLMTMIINDMGSSPERVVIKGNLLKQEQIVELNAPTIHEGTGQQILNNDVQRTKLKVALEEVPSTSSFRQQQLAALSEAFKASPPRYQAVMMPHMMDLANVPNKEEIIKAIIEINKNASLTEETVEQRIKEAVDKARLEMMMELKSRDLDIREKKTDAEIEKMITEQVNNRIEAIYSAVQAGVQIATMPQAVPVADQVLRSAGGQDMDAAPIVAPPPQAIAQPIEPVQQNTSPMFPPRVQEPDIEEQEMPPVDAIAPGMNEGLNEGIEAQGVQI